MDLNDDLEIPFDFDSFWCLDSPDLLNALLEIRSTPYSENEQNELLGSVPVSVSTSDVPPAPLIENSNIDQTTLMTIPSSFGQDTSTVPSSFGQDTSTVPSSFGQDTSTVPSSFSQDTTTIPSSFSQDTTTVPSSFGQDTTRVKQHQSFQQGDNSSNVNAINLYDMSFTRSSNVQREILYGGNYAFPNSTTNMMTSAPQSLDLQHGPLKQSHQRPLLSPVNQAFSQEPNVSTMVRSIKEEVQDTNGLTNPNLTNGRQNLHPSMFQEARYDQLMFEQLKKRYKQLMQNQTTFNMSAPTSSMGMLINNRFQVPFASTSNAIRKQEYHPPMITNTPTLNRGTLLNNQFKVPLAPTTNAIRNQEYRPPIITNTPILNMARNYSPLVQTSRYQPEPIHNGSQNANLLRMIRRPRGRPPKSQSIVPSTLTNTTPNNITLVTTTQSLLAPPRLYQEKGKQHVAPMPSFNPTRNNLYQIPYTNSMIQQSGNRRQRNDYEQCANEPSSSQRRRIMLPNQERRITNSSILSFGQNGNMPPREANPNEESSAKNTLYDPLYESVGLPRDPHLRNF